MKDVLSDFFYFTKTVVIFGEAIHFFNRFYMEVVNMKVSVRGLVSALLILSLFSLSGCGKDNSSKNAVDPANQVQGAAEPLDTPENSAVISEGRTSAPMLPVYFDFDSSSIRKDQVQRIVGNGDFMKSKNGIAVRIEGNCDPRGTNEYNMALGERRAQTAKKYLVNLGVPEENLTTVSYGEEKILLHGHDELSWAQNRRDDFVIVK